MTAMQPRYGLQTKQKIRARIDISGSTMKGTATFKYSRLSFQYSEEYKFTRNEQVCLLTKLFRKIPLQSSGLVCMVIKFIWMTKTCHDCLVTYVQFSEQT